MGAIVDILFVGKDDLDIIRHRYPSATVVRLSHTGRNTEMYRIVIPEEKVESYYFFLCDNSMATSSRNFLDRIISDGTFKKVVKLRLAKALRDINNPQAEDREEAGVDEC